MWTDDKRPWDHDGGYWDEDHESKPPPCFHFVQSIDKSPEIEEE